MDFPLRASPRINDVGALFLGTKIFTFPELVLKVEKEKELQDKVRSLNLSN